MILGAPVPMTDLLQLRFSFFTLSARGQPVSTEPHDLFNIFQREIFASP